MIIFGLIYYSARDLSERRLRVTQQVSLEHMIVVLLP